MGSPMSPSAPITHQKIKKGVSQTRDVLNLPIKGKDVASAFNSVPDPNEAAHRVHLQEIKEKLNKSPSNDKLPASSPSVMVVDTRATSP